MRKAISIIAILALAAGFTFAQVVPNYGVGETSASATQDITLTIPNRVALHVDTSNWTLDLNDMSNQACLAISKQDAAVVDFIGVGNAFDFVGFLATLDMAISPTGQQWATVSQDLMSAAAAAGYHQATSYPVVDMNNSGRIDGDHDKGYVACFFGKIVQKFSNNPNGWKFSASLSTGGNASGFGTFGLADLVLDYHTYSTPWFSLTLPATHYGSFVTDEADGAMHDLIQHTGTTGGWLDDYIFEGFYFDGSEMAGNYNLVVTYTLAGL